MVDRLNHQLRHLLPHDPDDKQFVKKLDRYEGYDNVDYSTYFGEILSILDDEVTDDAVSTRHRLEQRRTMHSSLDPGRFFLTVTDIVKAFHQVCVTPEAPELTAFCVTLV
jgi:hypothetical protein